MKKSLTTVLVLFVAISAFSQAANDLMPGINLDLIRSDNDGYFEKIQASAELNYFLSQKFTATGGVEYWSNDNETSLVLGGRWYPVPEAFLRLRAILGVNEFSVGGGWAKPLKANWRFEATGDFYTGGNIAIRAGFAYAFKKRR